MKRKFSETRDVVEKISMDFILCYFPNYAKFWENFIGINKKPNIDLGPYGLKNKDKIPIEKFNEILSSYNNVNQYHYSLLMNLYFAFLYYQKLQTLTFDVNPGKYIWSDYLEYRKACQTFYLFIGTARDMFGRVVNETMQKKMPKSGTPGSALTNFDEYLSKTKPGFELNFSRWKEKMSELRTRIMHYGSLGGIIMPNAFIVPEKLQKDAHWLDDIKGAKECGIDERAYINGVFKETVRLINLSYRILIKEYKDFLKTSGVKIDY